jgi:hypothetical protein
MELVEKEAIKMVTDMGEKELTKVKNEIKNDAINTLKTEGLNIVKNMGQQKLSQTVENKPSSQTKNSFGTGVKKKIRQNN